jgi:hypothetical protein
LWEVGKTLQPKQLKLVRMERPTAIRRTWITL